MTADGKIAERTPGTDLHTPGTEVQKANYATCYGGFKDDYYLCTECGQPTTEAGKEPVYSAGNGNHSIVWVEKIPATKESEGLKAHWACELCHTIFRSQSNGDIMTSEKEFNALIIPKLTNKPSTNTNTSSKDPAPATGDNSHLGLFMVLMLASMTALVGLVKKAKRV